MKEMKLRITAMFVMWLIILLPITTAWSISDLEVEKEDINAVITWKTLGTNSTSKVEYGDTKSNIALSAEDDELTTEHSITLEDLLPSTTYYYLISSTNESGDTVIADNSGDYYSFTTTSEQDRTAPSITDITVTAVSDTESSISWTTDESADSALYYGTETSLGESTFSYSRKTTHSLSVDTEEDTKYYYIVGSCDSNSNCVNSSVEDFIAGAGRIAVFVNASLPEYHYENTITFDVYTSPYSYVEVYVNDERVKAGDADVDGKVTISNLFLYDTTTVLISATDQDGDTAEETYSVKLDTDPPDVSISDIPEETNQSSFVINGTVDELVTIQFLATSYEDLKAPSQVTGLANETIGTNSVELIWDDSEAGDFDEYAIYKNGVRITVTGSNEYVDTPLDSGVTYEYEISAVDDSCNEGKKSDVLTITTLEGGETYGLESQEIELSCSAYYFEKEISIEGYFSETIDLYDGENFVQVIVTDKGGNEVTFSGTTKLDINNPVIEEHNLDAISPAYIPDVTVKGKVNEKSTVYVYMNDESEPSFSGGTDSEGYFSIDVELERTAELEYEEGSATAESASSWRNTITLIAVDESGLKSESVQAEVDYALCGFGSSWHVDIHDPTPEILTPRLIIDGVQQIGLTVNITWQGGDFERGIIQDSRVSLRSLSTEEEEDYDIGWVTVGQVWSDDDGTGYVTLDFRAIDPEPSGGNWTMFEKEENISLHREGDCLVPGLGCVKFPLVLEIDFKTETPEEYTTTYADTTRETDRVEDRLQKQCWEIEIPIDRRIPPDKIPEGFLRASIDAMSAAIGLIEAILEPIQTVQEVVFYSCMATWVVTFFLEASVSWSCKFSAKVSKLAEGGEGFEVVAAETGNCKTAYENREPLAQCEACEKKIKTKDQVERVMKWTCDRIFCPAAPTFQKYIKDKTSNPGGEEKTINEKKISSESSCAGAKTADDDKSTTKKRTGAVQRVYGHTGNINTIAGQYDYWLENKDKKQEEILGSDEPNCKGLHSAETECCAFEYVQDWDSACIVMKELKESTCLAAQEAGKPQQFKDDFKQSCNQVWNSAAGFCEKDTGEPTPEIVSSNLYYGSDQIPGGIPKDVWETNRDRKIYYRITPPSDPESSDTDKNRYYVDRGYIESGADLVEALEDNRKNGDAPADTSEVNVKVNYIMEKDGLEEWFEQPEEGENPKCDIYDDVKKCDGFKRFKKDLETAAHGSKDISDKAEAVYQDIQSKIGISTKDYIVDPTSGILRSLQCVCLPGIVSYLNYYKSMLQAIRTCFQTILVTGDGSPGVCQAVVSVYICDLIYELIACFKQRYGKGPSGDLDFGIGNFFGALGDASAQTSNSIRGRYGESGMWKNMFTEKKLVHSLCLWAFTGTWDFDVSAILEQDIPIPIASQGILYPCERRFISYNSVSNPSGLTSWNYHLGVGLVAGADLDWRLSLVCSDGYTCSTAEFENGMCDCNGKGEQTQTIDSGSLAAGEIYGDDEADGDLWQQITNSKIRFDKAKLEWNYEDNTGTQVSDSAECDISQAGGDPPAFCEFDFGSGYFRCALDIDSEEWIAFVGTPEPTQSSYKTDDSVKFDVRIQQQLPDDSLSCNTQECASTKYLNIVIRNTKRNREVYNMKDNEGYTKLRLDGEHFLTLPDNFKLAKEHFTSTARYKVENVDPADVSETSELPEWVKSAVGTERDLRAVTIKKKEGDDYTIQHQEFTKKEGNNNNKQIAEPAGEKENCLEEATDKHKCNGVTITVDKNNLLKQNSNGKTIYLEVSSVDTGTEGCDSEEHSFEAKFTIYNAENDGSGGWKVSSVKATDSSGNEQERTATFKASCDPSVSGGEKDEDIELDKDSFKLTGTKLELKAGFNVVADGAKATSVEAKVKTKSGRDEDLTEVYLVDDQDKSSTRLDCDGNCKVGEKTGEGGTFTSEDIDILFLTTQENQYYEYYIKTLDYDSHRSEFKGEGESIKVYVGEACGGDMGACLFKDGKVCPENGVLNAVTNANCDNSDKICCKVSP